MRAVSSLTRTLSVMSVVFLIWLALASSGHAQSDNAQISGVIRDPNGAVVSGAKVVAKSESKEFERTGTTNAEGYYFLTNIPPGMYTVWAERDGFKRTEATNKKVDPNTPTTVDLTLETGNVTETVSIVAAATAVQSETATVGKLIDQKQLENSGLNGRNPLFLALLKPGVNGGALGQFSFGLTTGGLNINGSRTQDNLITFDGAVAVRTRSNGTSIGVADVDSTQEVQILTANYNAEYGRSAGGQIRIVTKSGQQSFHGTAYEFLRNSALNANSFTRNHLDTAGKTPCDQFAKADNCRPSPFRYNQFGYSLSGPVILPFTNYNKDRSKLFWLWGQEWVRQRAASTTITTVPSLKMRNGDFSELLDPSNRFYGRQVIINDPKTGKPFVNNVIPASSLSANGLALLRAYPEPTPGFIGPGTANFTQTRPAPDQSAKGHALAGLVSDRKASDSLEDEALSLRRPECVSDQSRPRSTVHRQAEPDDLAQLGLHDFADMDQRIPRNGEPRSGSASSSIPRATATSEASTESTIRTSSPTTRRSSTRFRRSTSGACLPISMAVRTHRSPPARSTISRTT